MLGLAIQLVPDPGAPRQHRPAAPAAAAPRHPGPGPLGPRPRGFTRTWDEVSEPRRLEWHLYRLATSAEAGKEVRIFGLADELLRRHRQVRRGVDRLEDRACFGFVKLTTIGWLVFAARVRRRHRHRRRPRQPWRGDHRRRRPDDHPGLAASRAAQLAGRRVRLDAPDAQDRRALRLARWSTPRRPAARLPPTRPRSPTRSGTASTSRASVSATPAPTATSSPTSTSTCRPARPSRSSARTAPARRRSSSCSRASTSRPPGASSSTASTSGASRRAGWRERTSAGFQDFARFELLARESVGVGSLPGPGGRGLRRDGARPRRGPRRRRHPPVRSGDPARRQLRRRRRALRRPVAEARPRPGDDADRAAPARPRRADRRAGRPDRARAVRALRGGRPAGRRQRRHHDAGLAPLLARSGWPT